MKTKLTAIATAAALALSVPAVAGADRGGVPHSTKPCPAKAGGGKGKGHKKHSSKKQRGKRCGQQHR